MMIRNIFLIGLTMQLSGCIIGNGTICGPQTPMAMCDKKAYKALYYPTPLRDEWRKNGGADHLNQDWLMCGGRSDGMYNTEVKSIPGEKISDYGIRYAAIAHQRVGETQRCMINNGYIYTGRCDTDITKSSPGCQLRFKINGRGEGG